MDAKRVETRYGIWRHGRTTLEKSCQLYDLAPARPIMEDEDLEETNNEDCGQRARRVATLRKRRGQDRKQTLFNMCIPVYFVYCVYTMLRLALIRHQLARGVYVSLVIIMYKDCLSRTQGFCFCSLPYTFRYMFVNAWALRASRTRNSSLARPRPAKYNLYVCVPPH